MKVFLEIDIERKYGDARAATLIRDALAERVGRVLLVPDAPRDPDDRRPIEERLRHDDEFTTYGVTVGRLMADSAPHPPGDSPFPVGRDHPDTSHQMARRATVRRGTIRAAILEALHAKPSSDDDLEQTLNRAHQSVSGSRNVLVKDGYVEALTVNGQTVKRTNRYGNPAIVWTLTDSGREMVEWVRGR